MSRDYDETCEVPLLIVFKWMENVLVPAPALSLPKMMRGWKSKIPHS